MNGRPNATSGASHGMAMQSLAAVREVSAVVDNVLRRYGKRGIQDYVTEVCIPKSRQRAPCQDLVDVIAEQASALLGDAAGKAVRDELAESAVALTTNHHGVDYFAQSLQGTIVFSRRRPGGAPPKAHIVLACGAVPLDNLTYPQGMLIYDQNGDPLAPMPRKLPLFANSKRRQLVSMAPPIDAAMVKRAGDRLRKLVADNEVSASVGDGVATLLKEIYDQAPIYALADYSQQATVINAAIWQRLMRGSEPHVPLVYLELEKITSALLIRDMASPSSLGYQVLFDATLRDRVINELDRQPACWDLSVLDERARCADQGTALPPGGGSVLFWAVGNGGRPVPLQVTQCRSGAVLRGVDNKGVVYSIDLQPDTIIRELAERRVLPSLFLSFLSLALTRGVICLGGYYQAEYLPKMADGLRRALADSRCEDIDEPEWHQLTLDAYLSGMQPVAGHVDDMLYPVGPIELLCTGGLSAADFAKLDSVTVMDAHLASLHESVSDLPAAKDFEQGWQLALATDLARGLEDRIVVPVANTRRERANSAVMHAS